MIVLIFFFYVDLKLDENFTPNLFRYDISVISLRIVVIVESNMTINYELPVGNAYYHFKG